MYLTLNLSSSNDKILLFLFSRKSQVEFETSLLKSKGHEYSVTIRVTRILDL